MNVLVVDLNDGIDAEDCIRLMISWLVAILFIIRKCIVFCKDTFYVRTCVYISIHSNFKTANNNKHLLKTKDTDEKN